MLGISLLLFFNPFPSKSQDVKAVDVGLIGGATTYSSYENGDLSIGLEGGSTVELSLGSRYHPQVQIPSDLGFLLKHPDIRDHIRLEYKMPAPLLGFIPIRGTIAGDQLIFDLDNNIVSGAINVPLNLTLIGIYEYTFIIDIDGLDVSIPENTYNFNITVSETSIDLDLLDFREVITTLTFGYKSSSETEQGGEEGTPSTVTDTTEVSVAFLPGIDEPPTVLEPEDPSNPYETPDGDEGTTGETGPLTIDYVSSFDFDGGEASIGKKIVNANNKTPFVQVTDRRASPNDGWYVTAQLGEFSADGHKTLKGAQLHLKNASVISPINSEPPYAYPEVILDSGGAEAYIYFATPDAGEGTWLNRWMKPSESELNSNVQLEVPAGASGPGNHSATINWTIQNVPLVDEETET